MQKHVPHSIFEITKKKIMKKIGAKIVGNKRHWLLNLDKTLMIYLCNAVPSY